MSNKEKITEKQLNEAIKDYNAAYNFTVQTHKSDLDRIDSLNGIVEDFDQFFYEYTYVICASGFRAKVAARMCPQLVDCKGDLEKMRKIFKNESKIGAIHTVYEMKDQWPELRKKFTTVDSLTELPRIGKVVKYHLARNIGVSSVSKPDLHMKRWVESIFGRDDDETVFDVTKAIADKLGKKQGSVDFCLWVWLSHNQGDEAECCHGGLALR